LRSPTSTKSCGIAISSQGCWEVSLATGASRASITGGALPVPPMCGGGRPYSARCPVASNSEVEFPTGRSTYGLPAIDISFGFSHDYLAKILLRVRQYRSGGPRATESCRRVCMQPLSSAGVVSVVLPPVPSGTNMITNAVVSVQCVAVKGSDESSRKTHDTCLQGDRFRRPSRHAVDARRKI
jgi:hypothetical protein